MQQMMKLSAFAASLALAASAGAQDDPPASYTFRAPLVNGQGLKTIQELRGKPVLIEFWGTH